MTSTANSVQRHSRGLFKYKLQIAYNGTNYQGCQGARTQVVSISSNRDEIDHPRLMLGMNGLLPRDIRVKEFRRVPPDFSARYSALGKLYCYELHTDPVEDPLLSHMRLHVVKPLNTFMMRSAAKAFVGEHDFTQFSSTQAKSLSRNPCKTIQSFDLDPIPGGLRLAVYASGFLYRQVRHMVGAIIAAGLGTVNTQTILDYLALGASVPLAGRKKPPWSAAAAKGLRLERVDFAPHADISVLMHPDLPHDEFGRLVTEPLVVTE
ncbi:hypothetical protein WJX74_009648 [Apatococcus lobatus]|uniref:tRNA pseudouridine synthase n=1 Tax=Apatococcus lobatus TaxID=904363 RepID=A0AAW1Q504_9CHLO